jgi:hypothetical protein
MQFSVYKTFHEHESAEALTSLLRANNIEVEVIEQRDSLDSLYGAKASTKEIFVKIKQADFEKADQIISRESQHDIASVDPDHYLFSFSDDELFDIIAKKDEWSEFDFQLARKILKDRGKDISEETVALLRNQRINEIAKPEESPRAWIYAGYIFAFLGGLLGVFMGIALMTTKKTLPDGQKVYTYSHENRRHGSRIFVISLVILLISIGLRIAMTEYD